MAVPRSDPSKTYSLPGFIADLGLTDLSCCIRTTKTRREMKDTPANERLAELDGTIEIIDTEVTKGQRGSTANFPRNRKHTILEATREVPRPAV